MIDKLTKDRRSANMRNIRSIGTAPEMVVRRTAHAMGYRYRLHEKGLPGKPDLVFAGPRKVIFVHGCFWHQHIDCREGRPPRSNESYWLPKLKRNIERDAEAVEALIIDGWAVLTLWECETKTPDLIRQKLSDFLQ